jgi:hypothetical protein
VAELALVSNLAVAQPQDRSLLAEGWGLDWRAMEAGRATVIQKGQWGRMELGQQMVAATIQ